MQKFLEYWGAARPEQHDDAKKLFDAYQSALSSLENLFNLFIKYGIGGDHLSNKCYILALFGLLLLISIASAAQVNEAVGPFKVSFELPVKEVTNEIPDPLYEDYSTWYAISTSADDWFVNIVIIDYFKPHEIDLDANRRSVAATTGADKSESKSQAIDGKNGIYSVKSSDKGTMLDAIYWLDEEGEKGTKQVEITIASNDKTPDSALKALDSLKIR